MDGNGSEGALEIAHPGANSGLCWGSDDVIVQRSDGAGHHQAPRHRAISG